MGNFHHICAQDLHSCHIGCLFFDVHRAHVNVTFQSEIGCGCCHRNTVLTGTGLCDHFLLAHVLGKQHFAHAVIQLVRAGMVQILTLHIKLHAANGCGQTLQVRNRRGTALELLADAAQLRNKFPGLADGVIRLGDLVHGFLQFVADIRATIGTKIAFLVRIISEICIKVDSVEFHGCFLQILIS